MTELSKIEKVDLREIWQHEAQDFTPWLADHISELGEALGLELESQSQEAPVGGYSLDILAHDLGSNRPVIIENQLEGTNHDHLGKLLTYASGYDANIVVWISREFRDEHRQALDRLNQRTDEDTEFFGVVVELWKIDDSRPAVNFNLVSTPNEWRKGNIRSTTVGDIETSEQSERYRMFSQDLIDRLRVDHSFTRARKGQSSPLLNFSTGHTQFKYGVNYPATGDARVRLYIDSGEREWNKQSFEALLNQREDIESALQDSLDWDRMDNSRACYIASVHSGAIYDDQETIEEIQEWMVDRLLKFKEVFGPYLDELAR